MGGRSHSQSPHSKKNDFPCCLRGGGPSGKGPAPLPKVEIGDTVLKRFREGWEGQWTNILVMNLLITNEVWVPFLFRWIKERGLFVCLFLFLINKILALPEPTRSWDQDVLWLLSSLSCSIPTCLPSTPKHSPVLSHPLYLAGKAGNLNVRLAAVRLNVS